MGENLGLALGVGILRLSSTTKRFDPEVRARTTGYERMCQGPVMAVPGSSSEHKKQGSAVRSILDCALLHWHFSEFLNDRFRRQPPFELAQLAHCL